MIGANWHYDADTPDDPKPFALWDPDANIVIPIGLVDWLAELGVAYLSHEVITAAPLECASIGTYVAGTIGVRMKLVASPVYTAGVKYPFTVRVHGSDGLTQ